MTDERLLETSRRLAAALTPGDLDHTLERITEVAVEAIPDVHYASISVLHADGTLGTAAPTDDMLCDVDKAQYDLQEGPCYEAAVDSVHVVAPNLSADQRFRRYAEVAVAAGIRAQAGLRLFETPRGAQGALNLYSRDVGAFQDLSRLGDLFTQHAATALAYAQEIHDLQEAVRTRRTIGQALGIVMERYQLTDARAFAFLTRLSQHRNVKLRLVAQEIVAGAEQSGDDEGR